jgi:hypothetical protein
MFRSFAAKAIDSTISSLNASKTKLNNFSSAKVFEEIKLKREANPKGFDQDFIFASGTVIGAGYGIKKAIEDNESDPIGVGFYVGLSTIAGTIAGFCCAGIPATVRKPLIISTIAFTGICKGISVYNQKHKKAYDCPYD